MLVHWLILVTRWLSLKLVNLKLVSWLRYVATHSDSFLFGNVGFCGRWCRDRRRSHTRVSRSYDPCFVGRALAFFCFAPPRGLGGASSFVSLSCARCCAKCSGLIEFSQVFERPCSISLKVQSLKVEPKGGSVDELM